MNSEDSWETVVDEELIIKQEKRLTKIDITISYVFSILFIVNDLFKQRTYKISKEYNAIEIYKDLMNDYRGEHIYNGSKYKLYFYDIGVFIALLYNKIPARIYFNILPDFSIKTYLEYEFNGKIIETKINKGAVFSLDGNGHFKDQTINFNSNISNYQSFIKALNSFTDLEIDFNIDGYNFRVLDEKRLKRMPNSLNSLKPHPLYITKSLLKYNEFIHPKKLVGSIRGESVFLKNIKKLYSESTWNRKGMQIRENATPYKIIKDRKLFAEYQTQPIVVESLKEGVMEYFHDNYIPKDCIYLEDCTEIVKILKIKHAECHVGFTRGHRLIKGVFIYKKDCFTVNQFNKDYLNKNYP